MAFSKPELDVILTKANPELEIHIAVHEQYNKLGYHNAQDWIRETLNECKDAKYSIVKKYLDSRLRASKILEPHREELMLRLQMNAYGPLQEWVTSRMSEEMTKEVILEILSELFVFVQYHPTPDDGYSFADRVADVLEGLYRP